MLKPQNLDALRSRLHPVNQNEWRPVDYQLPRASPASDTADFRMICQHVALFLDLPKLVERRAGVLLRDIVYGMGTIGLRPR